MSKANQSQEVKILNNSYYSIGFPDKNWSEFVPRDNYISQISDKLSNENSILFLEGEEDSGKTTILAQFARKFMGNTITVFLNPRNIIDYQLEFYCANVCNQIANILRKRESYEQNRGLVSVEDYRGDLFNLRKKLKQKKEKIFLLIDGLELKIEEDPEFVRKLIQIIPIGDESFKIVLTGEKSKFTKRIPELGKSGAESLSVTGFSKPEIENFLNSDFSLGSQFDELYAITKGYPGRLVTLKRLVKSDNYSLNDISKLSTYDTWVEKDCEAINLDDPNNNLIYSLLALREESFSAAEISQILNIDANKIQKTVENSSMLDIVKELIFISSSAHKKYYSNQLRGNVKLIQNYLINFYANSDSSKSLTELPKLYMDQNDWGKVISTLDGEALPRILEKHGSLSVVTDTLEMGIKASMELGKNDDLWRFAIQGGIVNELDNFSFWESEIEARIAIDDFTNAIKLAESAVLKIDRFRLLALISRRQKELNNSVDEELVNLIRMLYESIDLHKVGNKIYDIVSDLIYAIPNLAIELIEKSSGDVSEKNINDWVVAKLAITAIDSSAKDDKKESADKKLEAVEKLNAPLVKKITKAISFLVGNYTSNKVIEETNKLSDSKERLRLLRLWLNNNRTSSASVEEVISLALDELVTSTSKDSYNLDILKDLSFQLPYVKDKEKKYKLLKRFQKLQYYFSELGLTKNKYIYQLNIFHTKHSLEEVDATQFINDIINEIENIDDILVKLESFSEVYIKLISLNRTKLEIKPKIDFIHSRVITLSKELYQATASHYKISQSFLGTISKRNPVLALAVCNQINTEMRRERAKFLILDSYLDNNLRHVKIEILKKIEESFSLVESKSQMIIRILERYSEAKSLHFKVVKDLLHFINQIPKIKNISTKSFAQMIAYKVISKDRKWKKNLSKKITNELINTWDQLDTEWEKIDIAFRICYNLAAFDKKFSYEVFQKAIQMKETSWMDSLLVARTYLISLSLIVKSYTSLLITENDNERDYKVLESLINQVPSNIERIKIWTELALYAFLENREDISRRVVETHLTPLFQDVEIQRYEIGEIIEAFIPIHIYNSDLVADLTRSIPVKTKEGIYSALCNFYVSKKNPFEIYDLHDEKFSTNHSDLLKAVKILGEINSDSNLYSEFSKICRAISENRGLTKTQVSNLAHELLNVVHNKFPDPKNIKHEGFQVLVDMKLSLLEPKGISHKTYWKSILNRADAIPNTSDRIFIYSILLDELPFDKMENGTKEKREIFDKTVNALSDLPAHYEFVQRVIDITDTMYKVERTKWKDVVRNAFSLTKKLDAGVEVFESQRNIIDSMYRLDPDFAKKLIKMVDDEDVSARHSSFLNEHLQTLELSKKIKNNKSLSEKETENNRKVVRAIIDAQRALNSNKITPRKISEITRFLKIGNKLPLHEIFPVYMYYLTNCAKTYNGKTYQGNVADLHRNNFEEAVKATNIVQILSHKRKISESKSQRFFIDEDFVTNKAVHPGSREEGLNFIRDWMHDEVEGFLIIADPYLEKSDLEILKLVLELDSDLEVDMLGSKGGNVLNLEKEYLDKWKSISDQQPPFTNLTFCWIPDKNDGSPFHDRWIVTKNGGLRIGTSLNSIGMGRDSEISVMKPSEALNIKEQTLTGYISRKKREINGMRISYKSFSL